MMMQDKVQTLRCGKNSNFTCTVYSCQASDKCLYIYNTKATTTDC